MILFAILPAENRFRKIPTSRSLVNLHLLIRKWFLKLVKSTDLSNLKV